MNCRSLAALLAALMLSLVAIPVGAQHFSGDWSRELRKDDPGPKDVAQQQIEQDILQLQEQLRLGARAKDRGRIEPLFAANYTMTHGSGMVDNKDGRIEWMLRTGGGFERMDVVHQTIRTLGDAGAVAIMNSAFTRGDGTKGTVRYMVVYARTDASAGYKGWQQVAAHVNFIPDKDAAAPAREPQNALPARSSQSALLYTAPTRIRITLVRTTLYGN